MAEKKKPNVIVFFTDQQRWDTVGCYGNTRGLTPNLDKVAQMGVRFENTFTCQPVCGPARACIQTGRYATSIGCYRNGIPLKEDEKTIAHYMKDSGYEVGYIGKWHLANTDDKPIPKELRGGYSDYWIAADLLEFTSGPFKGRLFDENNNPVEFNKYRVDALTDYTIDYLRTRNGEKPFFLFLSYIEPHHQNDMNRYVAPEGYGERYKDTEAPGDLIGLDRNDSDWRKNLGDYYGMCKRLDENYGRVIEELKTLGMDDNTVVIFTSDHGSHFKTRNGEYKRACHEACVRIPMVVYGPGFTGGKVVDDMVSLIDLPPTILDIGGAEIPDYMDGHSILRLAKEEVENWPDNVFIQISESQVARALRTKRWKYCVTAPHKDGWTDANSEIYVEQYLYDLNNDPNELSNLAGIEEYREVCDELAAILIKRMVDAREKEPRIVKL